MGSMAVLNNGVPLENGHSKKAGPEKTVTKRAEAIYNSEESRTRYEAYSRLQASAVAFGEKLPIPEIVAVGGQSDGKSSLLEALLGFRFNVREVEMGTRRPLMLQMIHDSNALEPRCRLQVSCTMELPVCKMRPISTKISQRLGIRDPWIDIFPNLREHSKDWKSGFLVT